MPALDALADVAIGAPDPLPTPSEVASAALSAGISACDASCLVAAARAGAPLLTADRRLCEAGRAAGYDVVWLGDLPLG